MSTSQSTTIQFRIDKKTKDQAQVILKKLGMDLSTGLKHFLSQVIRTKSIPFIARTANGHTKAFEQSILDELKRMKAGDEVGFKTVKELMRDLNS